MPREENIVDIDAYAEDRLSEVRPGAWLACGTGKSREGNLGFQSFRQ